VKTLTLVVLCLSLSSAILSAQMTLTDEDAAKLISRVQQTSASQLDSALPRMTFERWLRSQVGTDTTINWVVRTADVSVQRYPWIETDISIHGRPGIVIMIAAATKPTFQSLQLMWAGDYAEWPRLRDLPEALRRARDGVK